MKGKNNKFLKKINDGERTNIKHTGQSTLMEASTRCCGTMEKEDGSFDYYHQTRHERERSFPDGLWTYWKDFMQFKWDRAIPGRKGSD